MLSVARYNPLQYMIVGLLSPFQLSGVCVEKIVDKRLGAKASLLGRRGENGWLNINQLFFSLTTIPSNQSRQVH